MSDEPTQRVNPLLARIRLPGETFRLPSLGLFYKNGELDAEVVNGEIHVFPMTTMDEIIFKTPDRLFTGEAVKDVFSRCAPQVLKPGDLLAKDVDYIMACLRLVTYGPVMDISHIHVCENAKEHQYKVEVRPFLTKAKAIDPTTTGSLFKYTLQNGQVVHMRPPLFSSVIALSQTMDFNNENMTPERMSELIMETLAGMIESVDNISDATMIREWLNKLNAGWVRELSDTVTKISDWGANFKVQITCEDCGNPVSLEISTNPLTFFT
jgi:hypothetical protein